MKKILLIIALILLIFQSMVLATAIDIGSAAIDRNSATSGSPYTNVNKDNPANFSGKITSIEIWANTNMTGLLVATFFVVSGNNLSTRDFANIGDVTAGSKQTFEVDIDVEAGDYLGYTITTGAIEITEDSSPLYWILAGNHIPCTNITFGTASTGIAMSLYGTGIAVPAQVTGVSATDGTYTDKVRITWSVATGATGYDVWTGAGWVDVGDVLTYDHTTAPAPTITVGTALASDGISVDHVTLSIAGESANVGSSISYKVRAYNAAGDGLESATDAGFRGVGALTYQWQRSSGDADADYSNIDGANTDPYNDTGAPENGDGRYYKCVEDAIGAAQQTTNADRGFRIPSPTYNFFGYNLNP